MDSVQIPNLAQILGNLACTIDKVSQRLDKIETNQNNQTKNNFAHYIGQTQSHQSFNEIREFSSTPVNVHSPDSTLISFGTVSDVDALDKSNSNMGKSDDIQKSGTIKLSNDTNLLNYQEDTLNLVNVLNISPIPSSPFASLNDNFGTCSSNSTLAPVETVLGQYSYWVNSKSQFFSAIDRRTSQFCVLDFDFGIYSSDSKFRRWKHTPEKAIEELKKLIIEKKKLLKFTFYFAYFTDDIFSRLSDLFPYEIPAEVICQVATSFCVQFPAFKSLYTQYRDDYGLNDETIADNGNESDSDEEFDVTSQNDNNQGNEQSKRMPRKKAYVNLSNIIEFVSCKLKNKFRTRADYLKDDNLWPYNRSCGQKKCEEKRKKRHSKGKRQRYNIPTGWDYEKMKEVLIESLKPKNLDI